jgi:hypothetical protein
MLRGALRFYKSPLPQAQKVISWEGGRKKDHGGNKDGYIKELSKIAHAAILQLCPERLRNMSGGGFEYL